MRNRPYTKQELDEVAKNRCGQYRNRVKNYRVSCPLDSLLSMKTDSWDLPLVVAACGSHKAPYKVKTGRNNSTLRDCNNVLMNAYFDHGMRIDEKPSHKDRLNKKDAHYKAGHCAEPHAAHALLNEMQKHGVLLRIADIGFSSAFNCKNNTVHDYCGTCKLVFPQLQ